MAGPDDFEDPGAEAPVRPHRGRWLLQVAIVILLIVSMVFLAFVSGRGVINPRPVPEPNLTTPAVPSSGTAIRAASATTHTSAVA